MNSAFVKELARTIAEIKDVSMLEGFLHAILTPTELDEISKRLQIVKMLSKGEPQRKVADKLGVSMATITRGSREVKFGKGFNSVINWWKKGTLIS